MVILHHLSELQGTDFVEVECRLVFGYDHSLFTFAAQCIYFILSARVLTYLFL